jgi:hypothetical protein
MNLKQLRTELAEALTPLDVNVYAYLPGKAPFPAAIILAGNPYIESGQGFGERLIRFEVWISTQKGSNDAETEQGDALIQQAIALVEEDGWVVEYVGQPTDWSINNGEAYTFPLIVTTTTTI